MCCHLITLSHFHTLDNKLTLSRIHTWLQVITGMRQLQCLWQISHDSWWCRKWPCWCGRICSGGHRHIGFVIRASVQVKRWQFTKRFITFWFCCTLPNDCRTLPYFSFCEKPTGIPVLLYRQRQRTAGFHPFGVIPGRLLSESYNIIGKDRHRLSYMYPWLANIGLRISGFQYLPFPQYHSDVLKNIARYVPGHSYLR